MEPQLPVQYKNNKNRAAERLKTLLFRNKLAPFVLIFALIGVYVLFRSMAETPTSSTNRGPQSTITCSGVSVTPGQLTQTFVNNYATGTTFCIKAGEHVISSAGYITPKTGQIFIGEYGATIDGRGTGCYAFQGYGGTTGQQNVTVKNLVIRNFGCSSSSVWLSGGVKPGWGWTVENNDLYGMSSNSIAVVVNDNIKVRNNKIHDNQWYALNGGPSSLSGSTMLIENNEVYSNYLCGCHSGDDGATKFHGGGGNFLNGITLRGNYFYNNKGHAIWNDGLVKNAVIEDNVVENNIGAGIFHEIGDSVVIRNNTLKSNALQRLGASCYNGNILVNNGRNAEIYGNSIDATDGTNGICVVNSTRSDSADYQYVQNINVHDNAVKLGVAPNGFASQSGMIDGRGTYASSQNVAFNGNTYTVGNTSTKHFAWLTQPIDWTTLKSRGQESSGTITTSTAPAPTPSPAPTISLSASPTSLNQGGTVALTASASSNGGTAISKVELYDGSTLLSTDTTSPYSYNWVTTTATSTGAHSLTAKAYNSTTSTTSTAVSVTVNAVAPPPSTDVTGPTVSISEPLSGATVKGTSVTLTALASDTESGVKQVEFRIGGNYVRAVTSSPYTYNWNSTTVADGIYVMQANATDNAGNNTSTSITINVDNVADTDNPPSISLTAPQSGTTVSGSSVIISADASDDRSISSVVFTVDGSSITDGTDTASPYGVGWDSTTVSNGTHTIKSTATDSIGQTSSDQYTITVQNGDTTKPTWPSSSSLSVAGNVYNKIDLSWQAATDNVGVGSYLIIRNGVYLNSVNGFTTTYSDTTVTADTQYSYYVIARDAAGNLSANSNTVSPKTPTAPDTQAPSVPSNLLASAVSSSQINLTWSVSTDNIGVKSYEIYRNNSTSPVATVTTTSYGDFGLSANTSYTYTVKAVDAAGNKSNSSNEVNAYTLPPPPSTTGSIGGTVTADGAGLPGVKITFILNGFTRTYYTDTLGNYSITGLPAQTYTLTYIKPPYSKEKATVSVQAGTSTTKDITMVKSSGKKR